VLYGFLVFVLRRLTVIYEQSKNLLEHCMVIAEFDDDDDDDDDDGV
jgi:hypothetical protein